MSKVKYFGRDGRQCHRSEWMRLRKDEAYCTVRLYDNGAVKVWLEWTGMQADTENLFPDCYKLFHLHVHNYNSFGELRPDPVENNKSFPTEEAAVAAYEAFLERWTASHRTEEGEFVEEDNDLAPPVPPPPPNPDAPSSEAASIKLGVEDDGVGAW